MVQANESTEVKKHNKEVSMVGGLRTNLVKARCEREFESLFNELRNALSFDHARSTTIRQGLAGGILIALFFLSGCAFVRGNYDDAFNKDDVAAIKVGVSTRQDVAELLGAPERVIEVNNQEIFHYYTYMAKSGTLLFFSRTNVVGNDLYVFFSREGIAQQVVFGYQKPASKMQFWPFGD